MDKFHDILPFDGLWEDMNEASNFCNGECYQEQKALKPSKYNLRYVPTGRDLETKSIGLDGYHSNGFLELDMHSLFGTMEVKATHEWFQKRKNRTMIIERSAFAGMGKFGSRWLGDNNSSTTLMGASVTGIMMHNILGIPLAGADICGFLGNTTPELCARWHMVGAFYPFSRNHNSLGMTPQEPFVEPFKKEFYESTTSWTDIMRTAIQTKYHLVRYYYSQLMHMSSTRVDVGTILYQPMFFQFPDEIKAYDDQELNVMLGSSLKLSILSNELGKNETDFYFGKGRWCHVFNVHLKTESCFDANPSGLEGITKTLPTKAYDVNVHLRDGHIIPYQDATKLHANTTFDLQ